ncbi:MAG: sigma-70 family RNA polymerase sigma factor [Clostridiales bacterium]|nr:sigma-70 family RNA polymerase sigma factor [Clostridiales bacterium]
MNIPAGPEGMNDLTDDQLSQRLRQGEKRAFDALVTRYASLIRRKASAYRQTGLEEEDLIQEAVLGLLSAAESYDDQAGASFRTFAGLCIERRLLTACRSAARQKHIPLNQYVSLNDEIDRKLVESQLASIDLMNPENLVISREDMERERRRIEQTLSGLEFKVLALYLSGRTYEEIAEKLTVSPKAVDNALQRIRRKLRGSVS